MKSFTKLKIRYCKLLIVSIFSFLLGCMVVINLVPINKTCQIDDTDREYNIMRNSKLKNPEIIILIISAPKNLDRRSVIRQTWLKLKDRRHNVRQDVRFSRHYFVIGSLGLTADNILHLSSEQSQYNDILILPIRDSYKNLTHKVISSFMWLNDQLDVGLDFRYVLKCDDDSFIRLDNLAHEIEQIEIIYLKSDPKAVNFINDNTSPYLRVNAQRNKPTTSNLQLYWGYFNGKAEIKTSGKWKEDNWILCDKYLPYALGGGYILSKGLVSFLAKNSEYLRYYNSEDVSVGAWLSSVNNILRIHDRRFDTEWTSRGCQNYYLVSHNLSVKEMHAMYQNIIKSENMCNTETTKRAYYLYNWGVPPSRCCNKEM